MSGDIQNMMQLFLLVGAGVIILFVVLVLLRMLNLFREKAGIDDFSDILHIALIRHRTGGITKFIHRKSNAWFSFEKLDADGDGVTVALRIPRETWSRAADADVVETFSRHGFTVDTECSNESLIGKVLIEIDDIWDKASGASSAQAARILIEATGIGLSEKFVVEDIGVPSLEYVKRAAEIR